MYLVFDIGGTKTRLAASKDGETFAEPIIFKTAEVFEDGVAAFISHARELADGEKIEAVAGGMKGAIDREDGVVLNTPKLTDWIGRPLKTRIERELDTKFLVANDTANVGLGEATAGAGRGHNIVAYITVSTGVGGARLVDGEIDAVTIGFEPGHHVINFDETAQCFCQDEPTFGHPEAYISGTAFQRRFGKKPYEIDDPDVWEEAARILGAVLTNATVLWSPEAIVLGGSMIVGAQGPVIPLERVVEHFKNSLTIFPEAPIVKRAELGDIGGLYGGLALCKV